MVFSKNLELEKNYNPFHLRERQRHLTVVPVITLLPAAGWQGCRWFPNQGLFFEIQADGGLGS